MTKWYYRKSITWQMLLTTGHRWHKWTIPVELRLGEYMCNCWATDHSDELRVYQQCVLNNGPAKVVLYGTSAANAWLMYLCWLLLISDEGWNLHDSIATVHILSGHMWLFQMNQFLCSIDRYMLLYTASKPESKNPSKFPKRWELGEEAL